MKKYLLTLIALTFFLCEAAFTGGGMAFAADAVGDEWTFGNYTYKVLSLSPAEVSIKLATGKAPTSITTGATILHNGTTYKITKIPASGFSGCSTATPLSIGSNITTIEMYAFKGCGFNGTVTIPASVTSIAMDAFWNCTALRTVTFNASSPLTSIGTYLFEGCSSLTSVTLPPLLTALPGNTFKGCTSLTTVTIPASVTSVANTAFNGCTNLTTIHAMPDAAPTVSSSPWSNITPASITLQLYSSAAKTSYSADSKWNGFNISTKKSGSCGASATWELDFETNKLTISGSGAIDDYTGTTLPWVADTAYIYTASISNDITRIGNRTFYECKRLTSVSISSSKLTSIGQYAFYNCKSLVGFGTSTTQINIPKDVVTIENYAFNKCAAATKVYFMSSSELTTIGIYAFQGMSSMTDFAIYNASKLTTIGNYAVKDCPSLISVTLPASITSIGSGAFSNCTALGAEGGFASFKGTLEQWAQISFANSESNPAYVAKKLKINGTLVTECSLNVPVSGYAFRNNLAITSLTLGSGCTSIGTYAFAGCTNLLGTLTLPSSLTTIGNNAFSGCTGFTAIDLMGATGLTTLQSGAFDGMTGVTGVLYIPASVTSVGTMALRNMTGLSKIFANPTTAPSGTNSSSFTNITSKPLYVLTAAAYTSYTTTANWSDFTNIMYGGYCGAETGGINMTWELNPSTGLLTISGTGAMKDYANSNTNRAPWYDLASSVNSIKICDGVTHVGKFAFHTCSNATEVWMSTTVTECGASAFVGCSGLNKVKYGKTGSKVLSYATDWAQIDFGNYQANPLSSAHTLQVYKATSTMPDWGTVIGFDNRNINQIKKYAFYGCTSLTSAVLPSNVETIEESAFYGCTNLATVTLPDALTTIGKEAFRNCSTLTSITIPENVTTMTCHNGSSTYSIFGGCANLTTIVWNARNCASDYIKVGTGSGYNYGTPFSGIYSQITSLTFGENVERIPNYLCYHMDHLTSVTIPASVTNIGTEAFDACSSTMSVTCEGVTPPTLASGAFSSPSTKKLYLPHNVAAKAAYRAASGWSSFTEANTFPKIVQFDMQEQGSSIDPQYFDNITGNATEPSPAPTATGYSFGGWYQEEGCENAFNFGSTNITADKTLYAKWTINQYTVSFDSDGGSAVASITQDYNSAVAAPADPTKTGYTFAGWTPAVPSIMPAEDTECVAQWTINQYTVSFDSDGGSAVASITQDYNSAVAAPADPTKTGYTFAGWSPAVPSTMPAENTECVAQWTINQCTISFDSNGGSAVASITQNYGTEVNVPANPTKTGYTFAGWSPAVPSVMPGENTECVAQWTINSYDVTFDLQGHGTPIAPQSIEYNGLVSQPSAPSEAGFAFDGWYKEAGYNNAWNFSEDRITATTTLYAKWSVAPLTLNDNADNSEAIESYDGLTTGVSMIRTIISASYNTICLPFAMTAAQVETYFGAECDIEELTRASFADGNLKLFFTKRMAIEAGKPYLIKPQANVANPTIADVTIDNTARPSIFEGVTFTGVFSPTDLANSEDLLFLGASNTLYMSSGGTMKGMRAYFELTTSGSQAAARRSALIVFNEEVATGIEEVRGETTDVVRSEKIMRDGQLLIIRDGKTYNAQGALIK